MELIKVENKNLSLKRVINTKKSEMVALLVMINMFFVFICSYMYTIHVIAHSTFSRGLIPFVFLNLGIGIVVYVKENHKKNISYIIMLIIIALGVISTIFAVNPNVSLLGFHERDEGLLSIIYYFSVVFIASLVEQNYKKKIVLFVLLMGTVQCIYAICQIFGIGNVQRVVNTNYIESKNIVKYEIWATGFVNNSNFFGTYMLLCFAYAIGLFIDEKNNKMCCVLAIVSVLLMYGLLLSNAMSCAVGLMGVTIYIIIYCIKNKKYAKIILSLAIIILAICIATKQGKTTLIKEVHKTKNETVEIAKGNMNDKYGTNRLYIWKNTIKIIPKNLLHGVGIDNFYYAFDGETLKSPDKKVSYDKAHNEYLQILITEGIFCLIAYIILYSIVIISNIRKNIKKEIYLLLPVIGYLVQAFFNISVIEVAPIFFMALGFCIESPSKKINTKESEI